MRKMFGVSNKGSKSFDEEALNDPNLVSSIDDRLSGIGDDGDKGEFEEDEGVVDDGKAQADDEVDDDSTPDDEDEDEGESGSDTADDEVDDDSTPSDDEPTDEFQLPEAYVRCAVHQGWKREDVISFFEAQPEIALKTFDNIYQSTNKLSGQWSEFGRLAKQKAEPEPKPEPESDIISELEGVEDLDPKVVKVLKHMDARNKRLEEMLSKTTAPSNLEEDRNRAVTDDIRIRQIQKFFDGDDMEPYRKYYGRLDMDVAIEDLPAAQRKHRYEVMVQADRILSGAGMQGVKMSVEDALNQAHLLVTDPIREEVLVNKIKAGAKKRARGHIMRPSSKKRVTNATGQSDDTKPKTREVVLKRTEQRLRKLLNK